MSTVPTLTYAQDRRATLAGRVADYVELTKPRIAVLVLLTVATASCLANWGPPPGALLAATLVGTGLVAASASALNQWLERTSDALMPRTADRPLPTGRLSGAEAVGFGVATLVVGVGLLLLAVNWTAAAMALLTWLIYVWIYTPLKSRSEANTAVGAVAGAMPVLIGWSAAGAPLDLKAFCVFLIIFLWQFPHFMAIAWMYREQYGAAGLKMLSVVDPTGRRAGAQAVVSSLALVPVSLLPSMLHLAGGMYFAWTLLLGLGQLAFAVAFLMRLDEDSARGLLRASLVYLPAVLLMLTLGVLG